MDLLASLHLEDLPEQQTRTSGPSVASALGADPGCRLGTDRCCTCAAPLRVGGGGKKSSRGGGGSPVPSAVHCKACRRVAYCSSACRKEDATPAAGGGEEEEGAPSGGGHGPVICALLRLCGPDEDADERFRGGRFRGGKGGGKGGDRREGDEAAEDRVRSEYESYPATMANVLAEHPCYAGMRRGFREGGKGGRLTVHVVGASLDAELWGELGGAADAYADALADLAAEVQVEELRLEFIGPDCPAGDKEGEVRELGSGRSPSRLVLRAHRSDYDAGFLARPKEDGGREGENPVAADAVVFFNPGFTCPDYSWEGALGSVGPGIPFLVATNTEMEAVADCQLLAEGGYLRGVPPAIADLVLDGGGGGGHGGEMQGVDPDLFFGENPFAGSRVRQSGNMANDLFVKNRWMFGGMFGGKKAEGEEKQKQKQKRKERVKAKPGEIGAGGKRRKSSSRRDNPALI